MIKLSSKEVSKAVQNFTSTMRSWPFYSADKVEYMLRYFHKIGKYDLYSHFDANTEELIFINNPVNNEEPPYIDKSLWETLKRWYNFKKQSSSLND